MSESARRVRSIGRVAFLGVVLAGAMGACQGMNDTPATPTAAAPAEDPSGLTPAEKQLRANTEEKRKVESTETGATGGAVLGAITGYLIGWTGAASGGPVGNGYGSYMNATARSYSNAEARSAAVSKSAGETLAYYDQVNASAQTILAEQRAKIGKLNADYKASTTSKEQYSSQIASASINQIDLKEQVDGCDAQLGEMKRDPQAETLSVQIASLQAKRDSLKGTYDQLVALYATIPTEVQQQK